MADDLYDHPELYDALFPAGSEVDFYVDLAREQAGPVLELACGSGQLTIPIALDGHPTVGLDRSRAMLDIAGTRAAAVGVTVDFVQGDMRSFALGRDFRLIVVARNSLLHLLTTEELLASLTLIARHLSPGGLLAFDIFNPSVMLLARPAGERYPVMEVRTAKFGLVRVDATNDYDAAAQVNRGTWFVSTSEPEKAWSMPLVLRSIFPQELPLLLSAAGLELVDRFGELNRAPFRSASRVQVCLCRRRS